MVNGSDFTMDSAINIAQEIAEDLRILDDPSKPITITGGSVTTIVLTK